MARWSADAASGSRGRAREFAGELAAFLAGLVVLCSAVSIQGAWFTPPPATDVVVTTDTVESAELQFTALFLTVFTGPEWPGASTTR